MADPHILMKVGMPSDEPAWSGLADKGRWSTCGQEAEWNAQVIAVANMHCTVLREWPITKIARIEGEGLPC
jgi:hypothetical protein